MCFRPPSFEEMMKKCPDCATFNAPELTACKKCGAALPEVPVNDEGSAAPAAAPPKGPTPPKGPGAVSAPKPSGKPPVAPKEPDA